MRELRCESGCPYFGHTDAEVMGGKSRIWYCQKLRHVLENGFSMLWHGGEVGGIAAPCGVKDSALKRVQKYVETPC